MCFYLHRLFDIFFGSCHHTRPDSLAAFGVNIAKMIDASR